jgi:biotin carboxyl carrier protein
VAKHKFAINDAEYEVEVGSRQGGRVQVTVNGKAYDVELKSGSAAVVPAPAPAQMQKPMAAASQAQSPVAPSTGDAAVRSPMAGLVLSVKVKVGDRVSAGDELLMLEAMKMENAITAHRDGAIKRVAVEAQQVVNQGDVLIEIG